MDQEKTKKRRIFGVTETLECAYPGKRGKVLEVGTSALDIYSGEIVVIIGNSGAGKTTLIETLGLMSDTLSSANGNNGKGKVTFSPTNYTQDDIVIPDIWRKGKNGNEVTKARRENFNFIFQENNLMPNLKNDENITIADLIKDGMTKTQAESRTNVTCVSLEITKVKDEFPPNVSGGQRQRVAFARGIQPDFKVLFGDEPTGNLDEEISEKLMIELQQRIPVESSDRAAIIVSHNIDLALKFADKIIVLTKRAKDVEFYDILPEYTFTRESRNTNIWRGHFPVGNEWLKNEVKENTFPISGNVINSGLNLSDLPKRYFKNIPFALSTQPLVKETENGVNISCLKSYIKHILRINLENNREDTSGGFQSEKSNNDRAEEDPKNEKCENRCNSLVVRFMTWIGLFLISFSGSKMNKAFSQILFPKESEQLVGNKNSNFWFLTISIFLTFLIIGLANGQLHKVKKDYMEDPFTLTLDVQHKGDSVMQNKTRAILNDIRSNDDTMNFYKIKQITEYDNGFLTFVDFLDQNKNQYYMGRSMNSDDPLVKEILNKKINPSASGRPFNSNNDVGLIVTRSLMDLLHYDYDSPVVYCTYEDTISKKQIKIALPVIGFADQLPGIRKYYFLYTPNFYDYYSDPNNNFPYKSETKVKIAARINPEKTEEFQIRMVRALKDLAGKKIPGYSGFRKIEKDTNTFFRNQKGGLEYIYEFVIHPKNPKNPDSNPYHHKMLADSLFAHSDFKAYLDSNNLKVGKDVFHLYYFEVPNDINSSPKKERGYISFLFKEGSEVKSFKKMFTERTIKIDERKKEGLLVDIGKVNSMLIFDKLSTLTNIILGILIIIIVFTNIQYLWNLLNMHLYKIRRNIGTLMAFGINIKTVYKLMLQSFVFTCFLSGFVFAFLVGYSLNYWKILPFSLFSEINHLVITAGALFFIFLGSFFVFLCAKFNYFEKTPSELIYNRVTSNCFRELLRRIFCFKRNMK